eukprot:TRINITY_DN22474_c0_g1_i1.p1 TRINITY_DN22474_c0_g1~~TRINITY_DN22474_c0_g1_i1.p1  ORF type:complete len:127 (+),score=13.80 TRINITY_DN22474_c0_g1_i1:320-700(+)
MHCLPKISTDYRAQGEGPAEGYPVTVKKKTTPHGFEWMNARLGRGPVGKQALSQHSVSSVVIFGDKTTQEEQKIPPLPNQTPPPSFATFHHPATTKAGNPPEHLPLIQDFSPPSRNCDDKHATSNI